MTNETDKKCIEYQQQMYEKLGNREYEIFKSGEEQYLKLKIGFAMFGPPNKDDLDGDFTAEHCYSEIQVLRINDILKTMKTHSTSNKENDVIVSFLFNCCIFIEKKKKNDTADVNIGKYPIFRVKKCSGVLNSCCVYIDDNLRVYKNWEDYLKTNKIPKAKMFTPLNGKYQGDENGEVLLEILFSPSCALKRNVVKVVDHASSAASIVSGGISCASLVPAITVAPAVLLGSAIAGTAVGTYSVIRNYMILRDRKIHKQSMSLANGEVRNCALNIAVGVSSILTTGVTKTAEVALGRGAIISKNARMVISSTNGLNLTINGCNAANSFYSIVVFINNKKNPTASDITNLCTSFLFFVNAVVNFKSARKIVNQSQNKSFSDTFITLSQQLLNNTKKKFLNADVSSFENIMSLNDINSSEDFYMNMLQNFVRDLLVKDYIVDIPNILGVICEFASIITDKDKAIASCKMILSKFRSPIQIAMIRLLKFLLNDVIDDCMGILKNMFPNKEIIAILLTIIRNYLHSKITEMEFEYQKKKAEKIKSSNISGDEYDEQMGFKKNSIRIAHFLVKITLKLFSTDGKCNEILCKEMVDFFWEWLINETEKYFTNKDVNSNKNEIDCKICGGFNYVS